MLKSGLSADKEAYCGTRDTYSTLVKEVATTYYTDLIDQCARNSMKLFRVVNSRSNLHQSNVLPPHDDPCPLANEFGDFFLSQDWIDHWRNWSDWCWPSCCGISITSSETGMSEEEVRSIIMTSTNVSCQLDPIPIWLLKISCDVLAPIITCISNLSLEKGQVPDSCKSALVLPL